MKLKSDDSDAAEAVRVGLGYGCDPLVLKVELGGLGRIQVVINLTVGRRRNGALPWRAELPSHSAGSPPGCEVETSSESDWESVWLNFES